MKRLRSIISLALLACVILTFLSGCTIPGADPSNPTSPSEGTLPPKVDYASSVKLNLSSDTIKQEVTVKTFVDGDTVHFHVPTSISESGVLKARFLAVNTPESTGKIEEYGKKAANFTREKLSNATSIIVESDDSKWNLDSTGGRYLVWVWYKTADSQEYRNLNIEILQNGLAKPSSSANNRYGSICVSALNQAKAWKLHVHSGQKDPDFYYGQAQELTLKELRANISQYNGVKVAFEGVITLNNNNGVYVEAFDPETNMYNGLYVYYGFGLNGNALDIIAVGNRARIVGTVQYYEAGDCYQVSGLSYRMMEPTHPENIQKISSGHSPAYVLTSAEQFTTGVVEVESEDGIQEFDYNYMALGSSIAMNNLQVKHVYTTDDEESSSYGAMTLTCEVDGITIPVRTVVLYDENKNLVTEEAYLGKCIDVKGIVDYYNGEYQIKVFTTKAINIHPAENTETT